MKNDKIYLSHILESIESILQYTQEMTEQDFLVNKMVKDAVIRNFEIIGEATKRVSKETKVSYPNIP